MLPKPTTKGRKSQNTPEMNVSESDKKIRKIWAHNFEQQKSYSGQGNSPFLSDLGKESVPT